MLEGMTFKQVVEGVDQVTRCPDSATEKCGRDATGFSTKCGTSSIKGPDGAFFEKKSMCLPSYLCHLHFVTKDGQVTTKCHALFKTATAFVATVAFALSM